MSTPPSRKGPPPNMGTRKMFSKEIAAKIAEMSKDSDKTPPLTNCVEMSEPSANVEKTVGRRQKMIQRDSV